MLPPAYNGHINSVQVPSFVFFFRLVALGILAVLSAIVLGLGIHIIYLAASTGNHYSDLAALAVAVPALTFFTIIPSVIASLFIGTSPIYLLIEDVWLAVLWILWLGIDVYASTPHPGSGVQDPNAAQDPNAIQDPGVNCGVGVLLGSTPVPCSEIRALLTFSWLDWLALLGYVPVIFVLILIALITQSRKHHHVQPATQQMGTLQPVIVEPVVVTPQIVTPQIVNPVYSHV